MSKGQMDLNSIYSYKNNLGYPSKSKMMILVHARGNFEFFFARRALGKTATRSRTEYVISFEDDGLVFMQVNRDGMFTGDNSFMPRSSFSRISAEQKSCIGGHHTSSQYDMELFGNHGEVAQFTVYTQSSSVDWLNQYATTTINNLDYYIRETAWSNDTPQQTVQAKSAQPEVHAEPDPVAKEESKPVTEIRQETKHVPEPKEDVPSAVKPAPLETKVEEQNIPTDSQPTPKRKFKFCANCGNKMAIDDVFCQKCGTKSDI